MKTLNKILKAFQSIVLFFFKNKISKESDSILKLMNTEETEFLFI